MLTDKVLWRRITKTDMMGMTGEAAPSGTGGGAKHIVLGTNGPDFNIYEFLGVNRCEDIVKTIEEIPGRVPRFDLTFSCLSDRRGGEWRLARQHLERYPLWKPKYDFPSGMEDYSESNPPIIFIFKIAGKYHARFCMYSDLEGLSQDLKTIIDRCNRGRKNSGVIDYNDDFWELLSFNIPPPREENEVPPTREFVAGNQETIPPLRPGTGVPPERRSLGYIPQRFVRDTKNVKTMKKMYEYRCCLCGTILRRPHKKPYVEGCHIQSLEDGGFDTPDNVLILCPNHHKELDHGALSIDPTTMQIKHLDETNQLHNQPLRLKPGHSIRRDYLEYHFQKFRKKELMGI